MEANSIYFGLGGLVIGVAGTALILWLKKPEPIVQQEEAIKDVIEISKELSSTDLIEPICNPEFIKELPKAFDLCRSMFCRLQGRGLDGAGTTECENIDNALNKLLIISTCKDDDEAKQRACIEFFDRRI